MAPEHADNPAMAKAAGQVEAKHQEIYALQQRLQRQLPDLAARLGVREFNTFQHDYSQFDSEIERVKQGLDMVHASLTGQPRVPDPPSRRPHQAPATHHTYRSDPIPEGVSHLADAQAELNGLLAVLGNELSGSMAEWNDDSRTAWSAAQHSWAESSRRQQAIVYNLPGALRRAKR